MASSSASSDDCPTGSKKVRRLLGETVSSTSSNVRNLKSLNSNFQNPLGGFETMGVFCVKGLCQQHLHLCNFCFERLHLSLQWLVKADDQLNPLGTGEGLVWHGWVCEHIGNHVLFLLLCKHGSGINHKLCTHALQYIRILTSSLVFRLWAKIQIICSHRTPKTSASFCFWSVGLSSKLSSSFLCNSCIWKPTQHHPRN